MGIFSRNKTPKPKKIKLCGELDHDWVETGKCKDALGNHPCDYFPEGCNTCLTRFECYTKDNDTYRTRLTGVFYRCKKCPAVKVEGVRHEWVEKRWRDILDCRTHFFLGMEKTLRQKLAEKWKEG